MTTFTPPTKRRSMTKARAARIFIANDGVCHLCGFQIRDSEKYQIDHVDELADGGPDTDAACKPAHVECHKAKSAASRTVRAKRNRIITKGLVTDKPKRGFWRPPGSKFDWSKGRYAR